MNCQEFLEQLHPYFDGELDVLRSRQMEQHLRDCPRCAALLDSQRSLRKALDPQALRFGVPPALRAKIRVGLRDRTPRKALAVFRFRFWVSWAVPAAALVALIALVVNARLESSRQDLLVRELASCHVRSLMGNHLLDVPSTDQHTVKPWFNGKLDFAPTVKDFSADGFPLVGGRLDYVNGRSAAALVYRHRNHLINLFVWPATGKKSGLVDTRALQGFHLLGWQDGDLQYWAVSDLNETELREFVELWRK